MTYLSGVWNEPIFSEPGPKLSFQNQARTAIERKFALKLVNLPNLSSEKSWTGLWKIWPGGARAFGLWSKILTLGPGLWALAYFCYLTTTCSAGQYSTEKWLKLKMTHKGSIESIKFLPSSLAPKFLQTISPIKALVNDNRSSWDPMSSISEETLIKILVTTISKTRNKKTNRNRPSSEFYSNFRLLSPGSIIKTQSRDLALSFSVVDRPQ